ncbi:MAG: hypothetical protein LUI06_09290 [Ruminococcus sp.]|nr:hypothetical protein [Ruminococcus sp.]
MNDKTILNAMTDIDDRFIDEAADFKKHRIRCSKALTKAVTIIAAAAVLTISAGAAYNALTNRNSVEHYMGSEAADLIEKYDLTKNLISSNEHIEVTLDTLICDENTVLAVFTYKALDEEATHLMNTIGMPNVRMYYNDTDEEVYTDYETATFISFANDENATDSQVNDTGAFISSYDISKADTSREITFEIYADIDDEEHSGYDYEHVGKYFDGIEFTVSIETNVETIVYSDENGNEVTLSPISLCGYGEVIGYGANVNLVKKNGESYNLVSDFYDENESDTLCYDFSDENSGEDAGHFHCYFRRMIEITDYTSIKIGGVEYYRR